MAAVQDKPGLPCDSATPDCLTTRPSLLHAPCRNDGARHTGVSHPPTIMGSHPAKSDAGTIGDGDAPAAIQRRMRNFSGRGRGLIKGRERERDAPFTWMHSMTSLSFALSAPENDGREPRWFEKVVLGLSDPPFGIKYLALIDGAIVVTCGPSTIVCGLPL